MTGLEIALFILGTAFIVISFFIVGNNDRTPKQAAASALDADSFEQLKEGFVSKSQKEADIILAETKEKLEDVSNDKIIAVGEYSDQILEKIGSNHKEVVFLYQMLNEKEEELKATVTRMENTRVECEKMMKEAEETKKTAQVSALQPSPEGTAQTGKTADDAAKVSPAKRQAPAARTRTAPAPVVPDSIAGRQAGTSGKAKPAAAKAGGTSGVALSKSRAQDTAGAQDDSQEGTFNRNDEIIALYKKGKSVMEISKLLGIGQGEVKLIINLYC